MSTTSPAQRSQGLLHVAAEIRAHAKEILTANDNDLADAATRGLGAVMVDRLQLNEERLEAIASSVGAISEMGDPIGEIVNHSRRPNGLDISRVRIPLGVIAMIFESRPNVTSDAAALCLRSGNAVILRGGKEALHSNVAIGRSIRKGLQKAQLPVDAVQVLATTAKEQLCELLQYNDMIDLVIPRGGEGLIHFVSEHSRIPVISHCKGVCHIYVHKDADLKMAIAIALNAKTSRPGVCNAVETILVDRDIANQFIPQLTLALDNAGVDIRGDSATQELSPIQIRAAREEDWHAEYLDKVVAIRVLDNFDAAVAHIHKYGSNHTEAIVSTNQDISDQFLRLVHSSTVMVNTSTRFADGGELGLGAEIGISTTKLHAYGPMGAESLTTTKFVVRGNGQLRGI